MGGRGPWPVPSEENPSILPEQLQTGKEEFSDKHQTPPSLPHSCLQLQHLSGCIQHLALRTWALAVLDRPAYADGAVQLKSSRHSREDMRSHANNTEARTGMQRDTREALHSPLWNSQGPFLSSAARHGSASSAANTAQRDRCLACTHAPTTRARVSVRSCSLWPALPWALARPAGSGRGGTQAVPTTMCGLCRRARGLTHSNRRPLPIAGLYRLLQSGILIQLLQKNHPAAIGRRGGKAGAGRCVLLLTEKAALKYNSHSISLRSIQSQHTSHPLPRPEQDAGSASLPSLQCLSL